VLENDKNHQELREAKLAKMLEHSEIVPFFCQWKAKLEAASWRQHIPEELLLGKTLRISHCFIKVFLLHS
jgi:hypothetical protein